MRPPSGTVMVTLALALAGAGVAYVLLRDTSEPPVQTAVEPSGQAPAGRQIADPAQLAAPPPPALPPEGSTPARDARLATLAARDEQAAAARRELYAENMASLEAAIVQAEADGKAAYASALRTRLELLAASAAEEAAAEAAAEAATAEP